MLLKFVRNKEHPICLELHSKVCSYPVYKRKRVSAFIIDETIIQIGYHHFWLWIAIEPIHSSAWNLHLRREKHACC